MRLHLIGVSALVSAMETEAILRHQVDDAPGRGPAHGTGLARYLDDTVADWFEPARDTPH